MAPEPKPKTGGLIVNLWGKLVEAFAMVFYIIRGIYLLIADAIKNLLAKKQPAPTKSPPSAPTGSAPSGSGGGSGPEPTEGSPPTGTAAPAESGTGGRPPVSADVPQTSRSAIGDDSIATLRDEVAQVAPQMRSTTAEKGEVAALVSQESEAALPVGEQSSSETEIAGDDGELAGALAAGQRVDAKAASEGKAVAKRTTGKKTAGKKVEAEKAGTPKPTTMQKKSPRRGIRLKVDDDQGVGFD